MLMLPGEQNMGEAVYSGFMASSLARSRASSLAAMDVLLHPTTSLLGPPDSAQAEA